MINHTGVSTDLLRKLSELQRGLCAPAQPVLPDSGICEIVLQSAIDIVKDVFNWWMFDFHGSSIRTRSLTEGIWPEHKSSPFVSMCTPRGDDEIGVLKFEPKPMRDQIVFRIYTLTIMCKQLLPPNGSWKYSERRWKVFRRLYTGWSFLGLSNGAHHVATKISASGFSMYMPA